MSHDVVIDPDPAEVVIKGRGIFYRALATKLKDGSRVFVADMGRKQAYYARKKFDTLVGKEVLGYPAVVSGKEGYLFHLRKESS